MYPLNDRFETRKVVFRGTDNPAEIKDELLTAMEFETLYLKNKCEYYDRMSQEDQARLNMMAERLEIAGSSVKI